MSRHTGRRGKPRLCTPVMVRSLSVVLETSNSRRSHIQRQHNISAIDRAHTRHPRATTERPIAYHTPAIDSESEAKCEPDLAHPDTQSCVSSMTRIARSLPSAVWGSNNDPSLRYRKPDHHQAAATHHGATSSHHQRQHIQMQTSPQTQQPGFHIQDIMPMSHIDGRSIPRTRPIATPPVNAKCDTWQAVDISRNTTRTPTAPSEASHSLWERGESILHRARQLDRRSGHRDISLLPPLSSAEQRRSNKHHDTFRYWRRQFDCLQVARHIIRLPRP